MTRARHYVAVAFGSSRFTVFAFAASSRYPLNKKASKQHLVYILLEKLKAGSNSVMAAFTMHKVGDVTFA